MNHPHIIKTGVRLAVAAVTTAGVLAPVAALAAPAAPADPDMSTKLVGKTVFLDPGHQGSNHNEDLNRQVNNGRGGTKECQTTGMTTRNGVPEHTINWNVAQLVRQSLEALGAHVVMSRQDDTGWGGCVDERAAAANSSGAAVAVSIHADGAPEQDHGFHLIVPQLPVPDAKANEAQSGPGQVATNAMRDAYKKAGFTPADYAGAVDGLQTRSDIAGPALTEVPDVFIEMGNGANVDDAKKLELPEGQLEHAIAITTGLVSYLIGVAPGGASPAASPADSPANAPQSAPGQDNSASQTGTSQSTTSPSATPQSPAPQNAAPESASPQGSATPNSGAQNSGTQNSGTQNPAAPQQNSATDALRGGPNSTPATTQSAPTSTAPSAPATTQPGSNPAGTYRTAPGTYSNTDPGTSGVSPQTSTAPGTSGTQKPQSGSGAGNLATTAMQLLLPLAKSLGLGNGALDSELVNLAYTLVSTLLGQSK
ncbi:N-acetylmuramoyl-L-alanine amidase [Nocardia nova]|uniref:N-acetylmuramoyl-L-alanine amidase n=1 Tax=Nocardia nova TaxID=37330 RepID=UPI001C43E0C5|nr:N-acetylmuramoyl-L-alanine amidase [Nocardia nova]MBV7705678.1 N-acetylmuramoyl-L-alanine amidase [Nocardia nova]